MMSIKRSDLVPWVEEALNTLGGSGSPEEVCRIIWEHHQDEIIASEGMAYKWQYEVRWAKQELRNTGVISPPEESPNGIWSLSS